VLDHRGEAPVSMLHALSHAALARAAALQGDVDAGQRHYEQLFGLWRDADPSVQPLRTARLEFARLVEGRAGDSIAKAKGR
jgi:hypothetical protein